MRDNANFQVMNGHIEAAMAPRLSSSLRLIDFFRLGGAMPEEVVNGHGSQMLNLWVWTVMFNAMCPAEMAAEGSYAYWEGAVCSGTEARWENCPKYYPSCLRGPRCEKWAPRSKRNDVRLMKTASNGVLVMMLAPRSV